MRLLARLSLYVYCLFVLFYLTCVRLRENKESVVHCCVCYILLYLTIVILQSFDMFVCVYL